jgi:hypothetical protein
MELTSRLLVVALPTAPRDQALYRVLQFAVNPFKPWA